jgi:hypothetical protein
MNRVSEVRQARSNRAKFHFEMIRLVSR